MEGTSIPVPSCLHPSPATASTPSHCGLCCGVPGMATAQTARATGAVGLCLDGVWTTGDAVCTLHPLKACKFTARPLTLCPSPPVNKQAHARRAGRQVSIAGRAEADRAGDTNLPINHSDPAVKITEQSREQGKLPGTPANPTTPCLAQWGWPWPLTWHVPAFPLNLSKPCRDGSLPGEAGLAELRWHGCGYPSPAQGRQGPGDTESQPQVL